MPDILDTEMDRIFKGFDQADEAVKQAALATQLNEEESAYLFTMLSEHFGQLADRYSAPADPADYETESEACPHCGAWLEGGQDSQPKPRPTRTVLCGSTRFKVAYMEWNARLTLMGNVVLSVAMWSHSKQIEPTEVQKGILDYVHLAKIDCADEVFVLDVGGYIGDSTSREIEYAKRQGKPVRYLSAEHPDWDDTQAIFAQEPAS